MNYSFYVEPSLHRARERALNMVSYMLDQIELTFRETAKLNHEPFRHNGLELSHTKVQGQMSVEINGDEFIIEVKYVPKSK